MHLGDIPITTDNNSTDKDLLLLTLCEKPEDIRIVIAGHSHSYAVGQSVIDDAWLPEASALGRRHGIAALRGHPTDDYWRAVRHLAPGRAIAFVWNGNQHTADFMFSPSEYFDFIWSGHEEGSVIPSASLVPEELIRQHFAPTLSELYALLHDMNDLGASRIFVLGTPAPRGNDEEVRDRLTIEPSFAATAQRMGLELNSIPITPLSVRVKLWAVLQDLMREAAQANNAVFIESPAETYTLDNGLKTMYWAQDLTHANGFFGASLIRSLAVSLDASSPQ